MKDSKSSIHSVKLSSAQKKHLSSEAKKHRRSLHAEILMRLQRTIDQDWDLAKLSEEATEHNLTNTASFLSDRTEQQLLELFRQIRRDQQALLDLLNSSKFAEELFKQGFGNLLK